VNEDDLDDHSMFVAYVDGMEHEASVNPSNKPNYVGVNHRNYMS
jgi:hypothetical protein